MFDGISAVLVRRHAGDRKGVLEISTGTVERKGRGWEAEWLDGVTVRTKLSYCGNETLGKTMVAVPTFG